MGQSPIISTRRSPRPPPASWVLPRSHSVIERKLKPASAQARIGKSACDQCRYCTEFCPRFLLATPSNRIRSCAVSRSPPPARVLEPVAALCCACGLCTLYACPEALFPKEACDDAKAEMRKANLKWSGPTRVQPHPMREGRRVPIKRLVQKLHVDAYDVPAPFSETRWRRPGSSCRSNRAPARGQTRGGRGRPGHGGPTPGRTAGQRPRRAAPCPPGGTVTEVAEHHLVLQRTND